MLRIKLFSLLNCHINFGSERRVVNNENRPVRRNAVRRRTNAIMPC